MTSKESSLTGSHLGFKCLNALNEFWIIINSMAMISRMCVFSHSVTSDSANPWAEARQAPLSMSFPQQEYRSRLPFPPPGDLPQPGTEPMSSVSPALAGGFFTTVPSGKALIFNIADRLKICG